MKIKVKYIKTDNNNKLEFVKLPQLTVVERNPFIRITVKEGPIVHNIGGWSLPF